MRAVGDEGSEQGYKLSFLTLTRGWKMPTTEDDSNIREEFPPGGEHRWYCRPALLVDAKHSWMQLCK
jgi:hypothetical protein